MKIAVASGKGGTGKTLVATNLFYVAQQTGITVFLVVLLCCAVQRIHHHAVPCPCEKQNKR